MARARNIKPGFFHNADLVELSMEARLLFIGLWLIADRAGRLEDRPKQIKMDIFPADSLDCNALLDDLAATGMLLRYEVDGKRYLQVVNFAKHQNPHKDEKTSTIPDQCGNLASKVPTSEKHGASTVQAPCPPDADTVAIGLIPDSGFLIPDSGFLIPDPLTHTAAVDQKPDEPDGPVCVSMADAICTGMAAAGIADASPSNPDLLALMGKGADIGVFVSAAGKSVEKKKGFAYALGIVKVQMTQAAALVNAAMAVPQQGAAPARGKFGQAEPARVSEVWHESLVGVDRMAAELGMAPIDPVMETRPAFKARVMAAALQSQNMAA